MLSKKELRQKFAKEYEKHYVVDAIKEMGFSRHKCKKCGRNFWSVENRDVCADPSCMGYDFVGNKIQEISYTQTWDKIKKYFVDNGHTPLESYPSVARWRDDLYFTIASINDFQPYVVSGEIPPPANPLIIPQTCIRFPDVSNVGITGRHFTNFVMIGQHAFNTKQTGLFYWKDKALYHDINMMKSLGIPLKDIVFIEDVWVGGGNFGPSIEYFSKGLELGNCVFMQYEVLADGTVKELNTKVIDMGAGLERFVWFLNASPTSYEPVFGPAVYNAKKSTGVSIDEKLFLEYAKLSGKLNIDEVEDIQKARQEIAKTMGVDMSFFETLKPLQSIYAACDHLSTILLATTDGMLPSNSGGGYNLRMILRRVFDFEKQFNYELDYEQILKDHAQYRKPMFPKLMQGINTALDIIKIEKQKYEQTKAGFSKKIQSLLKKKKSIDEQDLETLYKSNGISPAFVKEYAEKQGVSVRIPDNFYTRIQHKKGSKTKIKELDLSNFQKTEILYYDPSVKEFNAKIVGIIDNKVILDKTAFYPESGGQIYDIGYIEDKQVKRVEKQQGVILHYVDDASNLSLGQTIHAKVDLKRRYLISLHHTATHLVNAACRQILGQHIWQAGAGKNEKQAHLDITHYKKITQEQLDEIEKLVNRYIWQDLEIKTEILPRQDAEKKYSFRIYQGGVVPGKFLRIVSIGNIDTEACGGTHTMLKSTKEIGFFKIIKRESVQDGIERLVFCVNEPAIAYIQEQQKLLRDASAVFNISKQQLVLTSKRFFEEWKKQKKIISKYEEILSKNIKQEIEKQYSEQNKIIEVDCPFDLLRKIGPSFLKSGFSDIGLLNKQKQAVFISKSDVNSLITYYEKISGLKANGKGSNRIWMGCFE